MHVLVAGASGHLGSEVVVELRRRGHSARALVRDASRAPAAAGEVVVADASRDPLDDAVAGVDVVFSALGGSSRFDRGPRVSFRKLDTEPNLAVLRAAERAGVERFAYVTLLRAEELRGNAYVDAHEEVVDALRASGVGATVIRANGFFSAYDEMLDLARRGRARVLGDPERVSNPIHDADLAAVCVDALESAAREIEVGGPQTLTRAQEVELANEAAGNPGPAKRMPSPLPRAGALLLRLADPRRAAILDFLLRVCSIDMVAPAHGDRRLGDYLRERFHGA